jgi:hypothetical protein
MLPIVPIAVITGASSGIGRSLALELAARQHDLILIARSAEALEQTAAEIRARYPVVVTSTVADLTDPAQVTACWQRVTAEGVVPDVLINNAGYGDWKPFAAAEWPRIEGIIQLNILAVTRLCHLALPLMRQAGRGRIMNVASCAGFSAGPNMATYFASKAYVLHFTEALAAENRGSGVTLTALCPGATSTEFHKVAGFRHDHRLFTGPMASHPDAVARFAIKAMFQGRRLAIHGWLNHVATFLIRFVPRRLATSTAHSALRR